MRQESKQKLTAARLAAQAATAEKRKFCLRVADWRIYRLDENNIALEKEGGSEHDRRHYPDAITAGSVLYDQLITSTVLEAKTLAEALRAIEKTKCQILEALRSTPWANL